MDPPSPGPFLAWYVDTFTVPGFGRFVICSEEFSLYSIIIPLGNKRSLPLMMKNFFHNHGGLLEALELQHLRVSSTPVFVARTDRRITGSQTELIRMVKFKLFNSHPPLTQELFQELHHEANISPLSYLGMENPRDAAWAIAHRLRSAS